MGIYNPNAPIILGEEWVDIRNEDIIFSPSVDVVELGHTFTPTTNRVLTEGRFYVNEYPPANVAHQVMQMAVYKTGTEALTGPVRSVLIPCNAAEVTGSGINPSTSAAIVDALTTPGDGNYVNAQPHFTGTSKRMLLYFATGNPGYAALLAGKRILKVELVQSISWNPNQSGTTVNASNPPFLDLGPQGFGIYTAGVPFATATIFNYAPFVVYFGSSIVAMKGGIPIGLPSQALPQTVIDFGSVNQAWPVSPWITSSTKLPWRYEELTRFEQSAGVNRLAVYYEWGAATNWAGDYFLGYAALKVTFCEENRVAYGAAQFGGTQGFAGNEPPYNIGANVLTMYNPSFATLPVLQAGQQYTAVLSSPDVGDLNGPQAAGTTVPAQTNTYPTLNGLRGLAALPAHAGVKVNVTQTEGETFTKETTLVLPQISLHTSGGPLPEMHVYGQQARGQVFGIQTVTQEVLDSAAGGTFAFPQVRFFARRFGNTTIPLTLSSPTVTGAGTTVSITPAQFDALPEVLDGWKQVDLRFTGVVSMGAGTSPQWVWSAAGELPGNRWEVLGATAPAISGVVPTSPFNLAPSPHQLSTATYGQPSAGATINMGWMPQYAPPVSGSADDQTSDAVLIFSQDSPTVSGFTVLPQSQALTGIGLNCNTFPWYIPSSLSYNQLAWTTPTGLILDTFSTPAVSGWSPADTGQTWSISDGIAANFSVSGGTGNQSVSVVNLGHGIDVNVGTTNQDLTIFVTLPALITGVGAAAIVDLRIRKLNANNFYSTRLTFNTGGVINVGLNKTVAGVGASLGTAPDLTQVVGHTYGIRVSAIGTLIQAKAWDATTGSEPTYWQVSATNAELATGNLATVFSFLTSAVTNTLPFVFAFDNLNSEIPFSYYEIQRQDTITDWQTIAQMTSPFVTGFRDYEARVGLLSSYRIRGVNSSLFAGPWSATASLTMATPGLTGVGMTGTPYVLMFTSNYRQNGSRSLAYALAYDGTPTEQFQFPESAFTQYQLMYNRDFQVAFRPLERGGETFSRTILIQAAAIPPETLADFKSLRDLAWDTLPYVCVRDQDGNRWFANVTVPSGRVQHKRQLYLAEINVIELTDTSAVTVV